ncbi:hypothetical protein OPQ81_003879 [Rhizoctonia solani]|nr:hypothetical protein OPQ81_003879 [Rhizoctonia solani]
MTNLPSNIEEPSGLSFLRILGSSTTWLDRLKDTGNESPGKRRLAFDTASARVTRRTPSHLFKSVAHNRAANGPLLDVPYHHDLSPLASNSRPTREDARAWGQTLETAKHPLNACSAWPGDVWALEGWSVRE